MKKLKPKWLPLRGVPSFEDDAIYLQGPMPPSPKKGTVRDGASKTNDDEDPRPRLLLRSDAMFEDGEISCEVRLEHSDSKVQFRLGVVDKFVTFVGINLSGHAYGIVHTDNGQNVFQNIVSADAPPPVAKWIPVHIRVQGSLIELNIDGIRVATLQVQLSRAPLELVLRGYGRTEVRNITVTAAKPQAFVVMQFTDEFNQLFREVIQPVCEEFGCEVIRGDNIFTNNLIIEDIAKTIRESSLVIADITPNNANVYYEVGFAHGIDKPTVLLSDRKREKLPFDISGFRLIFYDNSIAGKSEVENALRKHLTALRL